MSRSFYTTRVRDPRRPRGKWHIPIWPSSNRTICDKDARGWDRVDKSDIGAGDTCVNCLRDTP